MKPLSFSDFYAVAKEKLSYSQFQGLDPAAYYCQIGSCMFGLLAVPEDGLVVVNIALGIHERTDFSDFLGLKRYLLGKNVRRVGFMCDKCGFSEAVARYYGAVVTEIENRLRCVIDLEARRGK